MASQTTIVSNPAIVACLREMNVRTEEYATERKLTLGPWQYAKHQRHFFEEVYPQTLPYLGMLTLEELETAFGWNDPNPVNEMMARHQLPVSLEPDDDETLFTGAVVTLKGKWAHEGKKSLIKLHNTDQIVPSAEIPSSLYEVGADSPLFELPLRGKTGRHVYAVRYEKPGQNIVFTMRSVLSEQRRRFTQTVSKFGYDIPYTGVNIPMINVVLTGDIPEVLNAYRQVGSRTGRIKQAKQAHILKLNEVGFVAKSGAAMAMTLEAISIEVYYDLQGPYLFAVTGDTSEGQEELLYVAHVCPDAMEDPGKIDELDDEPDNEVKDKFEDINWE